MTEPATDSEARDPDLRLAGLHLRLGSLALARAELEAMAGRDALDQAGLVDLAETRWRTGDLGGAGEAAEAALKVGPPSMPALIVAAEAAAGRGRPTEARRLAGEAMALGGTAIDRWFAGMPRAPVWPADVHAPPPAPVALFQAGPGAAQRHAAAAAATAMAAAARAENDGLTAEAAKAATVPLAMWRADEAPGAALDLPAPELELERGTTALQAGDTREAAVRLSLALRLSPALAPAVLDAVGDQVGRELALVRGDAYRLVGRELDARRAFADAAVDPADPAAALAVTPAPSPDIGPDPPAVPGPSDGPQPEGAQP